MSLYSIHYYFGRVHQTLRVTPVIEAGLDDMSGPLKEPSPSSDNSQRVLMFVERLRHQAEEFQRTIEEEIRQTARAIHAERHGRRAEGEDRDR